MRRILLGGLGITLGLLCRPALAQQPTAGTPASPPPRAATFGRPSAVPDTPPPAAGPGGTARSASPDDPDPEITPAGLLNRNGRGRLGASFAPPTVGTPTPVMTSPPPITGGIVTPIWTQPGSGQPIPPPRPVTGGQPMVTEGRDPLGTLPGTIVPSIGPDGYPCPVPGLEDPIYSGVLPGRRAIDRLRPGEQAWVSAEVLLWWTRSTQVPALVTTSSPQFNGIPGTGDTQVLLGGSFGETFHVGGRIGFGFWFGDNQCRGVDARLFWVSPTTADFSAGVPPFALLARPFFNVNPNVTTPGIGFGPSAEIVAGPGVATGTLTATMETTVWGAEANYRRFLCGDACRRVDFLAGYRYLGLHETLTINETFVRVPGSNMTIGTPASFGAISDRIRTENDFHGGQFGFAGEVRRGRWYLDGRATIAFGNVSQSAEISGAQVLTFPNGMTTVTPGGLLAVPGANIGTFKQDRFAVVPEVGVNIGYHVTQHLRVFVGYNFLYLSSALRPGEMIDTRLDAARVPNLLPPGATPVPGVIRPQPQLSTSGFFVQGISFGLQYKW